MKTQPNTSTSKPRPALRLVTTKAIAFVLGVTNETVGTEKRTSWRMSVQNGS